MGLTRPWYLEAKRTTHTAEYANKRKMEHGVETATRNGWRVTQVTPVPQGCAHILVPFAGPRYVVMFERVQ